MLVCYNDIKGIVPKKCKGNRAMKKFLTIALTAAMLCTGASSVFAEDAVPATELALTEGSHLVLDRELGYVDKIDGTITVAELKANFAGAVTVADKTDDNAVATDDVITAGADSLKALIYGDVDRNGKINLGDASALLKTIAKWDTGINTDAADVDKTGKINLADASKLLKYLAKWKDISLGNVRMVFENKAQTAENDDSTLQLSFTSIMNKLGAHEAVHTGEHAYKMTMARNEYESCSAILYSETAREGMTAELSEFVSEYGDAVLKGKLQYVIYQPDLTIFTRVIRDGKLTNPQETSTDDYPEVIVDMADTFELQAGTNQMFIITVDSDKDTPEGMYKATLTVRDAEGKEVKKADVYAYVYDFTLPDTPYSASLFAGNQSVDNYEFLLEHNLSDYCLPYSITDERADAYMSDPRVTAFVIAGGGQWYGHDMYGGIMDRTDEQTVANYEKVMSNPDWAKKGLFYYTDEPCDGGLYFVKQCYERVTELLGTTNIRNTTPLASNNSYADAQCQADNIDAVDFIDPYINVWCPQSNAYHLQAERGTWTPRRQYNKYGEYADRAKAFREKGEEIWWYVCVSPEVPYANYFNCYQGVINRLLSWQQFFNDVDGVLYYRTFGGYISKYNFDIGNGDGILQYYAKLWQREGYAASWRLLQVRDGFDDFDYLSMAEELVGREAVMKVVTKVSGGMLNYTEDYRVLEAARDEIMDMIIDAQAK